MAYYWPGNLWRRFWYGENDIGLYNNDNGFNISSTQPQRLSGMPRQYNPYTGFGNQFYSNANGYTDQDYDAYSLALKRNAGYYSPRPTPYRHQTDSRSSDSYDNGKHKRLLKKQRYKEKSREELFRVIALWSFIGLLAFTGLSLGLGLGFGLNSSDDDILSQDNTRLYQLTYIVNGLFDPALNDETSQAYIDLRDSVVNALGPICNCEGNDVSFFDGSIGVSLTLEVPETTGILELQTQLASAAEQGILLPGYDVVPGSITLVDPLQFLTDIDSGTIDMTTKDLTIQATTVASATSVPTTPLPIGIALTTAEFIKEKTTVDGLEKTTLRDQEITEQAKLTTEQETTAHYYFIEQTTPEPFTTQQDKAHSTDVEKTTAIRAESSTVISVEPSTQEQTTTQVHIEQTTLNPTTQKATNLPDIDTTASMSSEPIEPKLSTMNQYSTETTFGDITTVLRTTNLIPTTQEATTLPDIDTTASMSTEPIEPKVSTIHQYSTETTFEDITTVLPTTFEPDTTEITTLDTAIIESNSTPFPIEETLPPVLGIEYKGVWAEWSEWTECTVSCNGGIHSRDRTCDGAGTCLGIGYQENFCNEMPCPLEPRGIWETWAQWNDCSETCGSGSRLRIRICNQDPEELECVGNSTQLEVCNTFNCPDCNQTCPEGVLTSCSYCFCETSYFSGMVVSTQLRLSLSGVTISPHNRPDIVLQTTTDNGRFNISGPCVGTQLLFKKEGFTDTHVVTNEANDTIAMARIDPLEVEQNPIDKKRLVGEDVTFCCSITGEPGPKNYEWFKDGQIIFMDDSGETNSTLTISNLSISDSSSYRCRANSEYSAKYSGVARLSVKESRDDFCVTTPLTSYRPLPSGCSVNASIDFNNGSFLDVGKCREGTCRGNESDNGQCQAGETFCCGPTNYTEIAVDCGTYYPKYNVIERCGCRSCLDLMTLIKGVVLRSSNEAPIQDADIFYNGINVDASDVDGKFNFTIDGELERITMTVEPPNNTNLIGTTQTLTINKRAKGLFVYTIKLLDRAPSIEANASEELVAKMNASNSNKSLGELVIPANSFFDERGNAFKGQATVSITAIEPNDQGSSEVAPGDFTANNVEGEQERLQSLGMFLIEVENNGEKLQAPGNIPIMLSDDQVGNAMDENGNPKMKLWSMNKRTGLWNFESDIISIDNSPAFRRRKRQTGTGFVAQIRGISISQRWYNFDAVASTTCYSKIRVLDSDSSPIENAQVSVVVLNDGASLSTRRAITDSGDGNGYCIAHRCDNEYRNNGIHFGFMGRIIVDVFGKVLHPIPTTDLAWYSQAIDLNYEIIKDTIATDLHLKTTDASGPFYNWDTKWHSSNDCSFATESENSFTFIAQSDCEITNPIPGLPEHYDGESLIDRLICETDHAFRYKLMYPFHLYHAQDVRSCYIRVHVPTIGYEGYRFRAKSRVGTAFRSNYIMPDQEYGTTENCVHDESVCLEVKLPGLVSCSIQPETYLVDEYTRVIIEPNFDHSLMVSEVNENFDLYVENNLINDNITKFDFNFYSYMAGPSWGLYCESAASIDDARSLAKESCKAGDTNDWAVKFQAPSSPCRQLAEQGITQDGIYSVDPDGNGSFDVYCELDPNRSDGSTVPGWTVFQRRLDDTVDFYRNWEDYENGFGDLNGNFWLGLKNIARLTRSQTLLHVFVEDFDGIWGFAEYASFRISNSSDDYRLFVFGYSGNATDGLAYHNGFVFSTFDRNQADCAIEWQGAWWYNSCHHSNLNGRYLTPNDGNVGDGIMWRDSGVLEISKKTSIMKLI